MDFKDIFLREVENGYTGSLEEFTEHIRQQQQFHLLVESATNLHKRFDNFPPELDPSIRKFMEEVGEFIVAVKNGNIQEAFYESADVLVTLINCLAAAYPSLKAEDLNIAQYVTRYKNDAKTTETHFINKKGLIEKKG